MSDNTVTITHEWRGSHTNSAGHPRMQDTHIVVLQQTREQLAAKALRRPGVKFVEYNAPYGDSNATTGWAYYFQKEEYAFSQEDSDSSGGKWRGTVTCNLSAIFEKDHLG